MRGGNDVLPWLFFSPSGFCVGWPLGKKRGGLNPVEIRVDTSRFDATYSLGHGFEEAISQIGHDVGGLILCWDGIDGRCG